MADLRAEGHGVLGAVAPECRLVQLAWPHFDASANRPALPRALTLAGLA